MRRAATGGAEGIADLDALRDQPESARVAEARHAPQHFVRESKHVVARAAVVWKRPGAEAEALDVAGELARTEQALDHLAPLRIARQSAAAIERGRRGTAVQVRADRLADLRAIKAR